MKKDWKAVIIYKYTYDYGHGEATKTGTILMKFVPTFKLAVDLVIDELPDNHSVHSLRVAKLQFCGWDKGE